MGSRHPAGAQARKPRPDGGRRRRPIDLLLSRRDRAQHPRLSRPVLAACEHHYPRPQLSLDANGSGRCHGVIGLAKERFYQEPLDRTDFRSEIATRLRPRRGRPGAICRRTHPGKPPVRHAPQRTGRSLPDIQPQRSARNRVDASEHSVREIRRTEVSRRCPHQGHAGVAAVCRGVFAYSNDATRRAIRDGYIQACFSPS
jgi:hypothetical protein